MRRTMQLGLALLLVPSLLAAQRSVAERLRAAGTRTVAFSARARPGVCGDGSTSYSDGLSGPRTRFYTGIMITHAPWERNLAPCDSGPVRVTVRMVEGQPSWLRIAAGPLPVLGDTVLDLGAVSTRDAGEFLRGLARGGDGRPAIEALLPIVMIDSLPRWEILVAAAADSTRMQRYRRKASDLLARAAASTLGLPSDSEDEAAATRREAVYALARQREKSEDVVPQLLEIARTNSHKEVRVAALYQLGQIGDARAIALFSSMLQGK